MNINDLNDKQKQVVLSKSQFVRIIAGAGSGKTKVLTSRIAYLIKEQNVIDNQILAITFTNKAANEMKERVCELLNNTKTNAVVCTIHSLCVKILRQDIAYLGYPSNFTIIDSLDQKAIIKKYIKQLEINDKVIEVNQILNYIYTQKANNNSYTKAKQEAEYKANIYDTNNDYLKLPEIYRLYTAELFKLKALDFDDLLFKTRELFKANKNVKDKWSRIFKYVHIDEFQDVDNVQYDIVKLLINDTSTLFVVGDPDQTIYTWRGADVSYILEFEKDFPNVETIILNQNYRSTSEILNASNHLIKGNVNRIKKDLIASGKNGLLPTYKKLDSDFEEANYVAERILNLRNNGVSLKNIGVLYRANYLSRVIEKRLIELQIPYLIYGGVRFYERAEIKDALSFLRIVQLNDDLSFNRIINTPKRGVGQKTLDTILEESNIHGITMYETIKNYDLFSARINNSLNNFVNLIEDLKIKSNTLTISELMEYALKHSGYLKELEDKKEDTRIENLKELVSDIIKFEEEYPNSTLDEYLQLVALYGDKSQYNDSDLVQMMSIHSSKGLEFDHVFIIGLSDGIFPSSKSLLENGLEEERRLMYVAMTRAKKELNLTDADGFSFVLGSNRLTSRFIDEIDDSLLNKLNKVRYNKPYMNTTSRNVDHDIQTFKSSLKDKKIRKLRLKKGDKVEHDNFGLGIVISIDPNYINVAFNASYGIKKIHTAYGGLKKI